MNEHRDIDPTGLARLHRLGGPAFVENMIDLFFREIPVRLAAARKGEQTGDLRAVCAAAHSIKSSAMNFGAISLNAIAEKLEAAMDANNSHELSKQLDDMEEAYARVKSWLESQKASLKT